jgi:hypothetical protein
LFPFTLPSLFKDKNIVQFIELNQTNYTKQTPNVKSGPADLSRARQSFVVRTSDEVSSYWRQPEPFGRQPRHLIAP